MINQKLGRGRRRKATLKRDWSTVGMSTRIF